MNHWKLALGSVTAVITLLLSSPSPAGPAYPLKQSPNRRFLVDQTGAPCLLLGESPQALMVNLDTNQAAVFFANRAGHGFNTVWVNLLCSTYTGGRPDSSTVDGIVPFLGTLPQSSPSAVVNYNLTLPNETYFARADQMIRLAGQAGIQVLLDPCETGAYILQSSLLHDNGSNRCRAYGKFLGNRYRDFPNIIWMSGNDFQTWRAAADDTVVRAVAQGILDADTNHLQTTELDYLLSSSLDNPAWSPILGLNGTYTYFPTYARLWQDYGRTNFLPNFLVEANYEFESLQGPITTAPILRKQEYWTMTSGACGFMYGNGYTWPFLSGWENHLDTPGAVQVGYLRGFLEARAWHLLVPDTNHLLVTSGYGAYSDSGHVADNDFLTAARTPDGSLAVIYTPTLRQFSVDLSVLSGPAAANWFDPAAGAYHAIAGSPLTNSGTLALTPPGVNADGDGGWVLVLETNPPVIPPPPPPPPPRPRFVQLASATPQTPRSLVSLPYPAEQTAGNLNLLAVGWNDATNLLLAATDSMGNSYQVAAPVFRGNGMSQALYYGPDIKQGSNTVTVQFDHPAAFVDLRIAEYSGLNSTDALDVAASATGIGANASSGLATVAAANELLCGAGMTAGSFTSAGTAFTLRIITSPDADLLEDQVAPDAGAYAATATLGASAWLMQMVAFKPAASLVPALEFALTDTNTLILSWPTNASNFQLQESSSVAAAAWVTVSNAAESVGAQLRVLVTIGTTNLFYRLIQAQ